MKIKWVYFTLWAVFLLLVFGTLTVFFGGNPVGSL